MSDTTSSLKIRFRDFGDVLVTRDQGEPVRKELVALLNAHPQDHIEIDLDDVEAYTPSFMDEVLGKCLQEIGVERFRNQVKLSANQSEVRKLANLVLSNRAAKK